MYKLEVVIDCVNKSVSFMGNLVVAKLLNQSSEWSEAAKTVNTVILKPYTEAVVRVSLQKAYRGANAVVLEPMTRLENQQFRQREWWFIRQGELLPVKFAIPLRQQLC